MSDLPFRVVGDSDGSTGSAEAGPEDRSRLETRRDTDRRPSLGSPDEVGLTLTVRETPLETRREGRSGGHESTIVLPMVLRERYSIVEQLPDPGAEADVLRTRALDGSDVVVKLYRLGVRADRDVWARIGTVDSPHVVRILETGEAAGRDFECMEYLGGGNLLSLVPRGVGATPATVRTVVEQVTEALDALHGLGIIHCDLKPENILIRSGGPSQPRHDLCVVLTDFGLARAPEQSIKQASRSGTLAYLAPELMLRSGPQSSKARDWWALGVVVRELLTGERPFGEMTEHGVEWSVLLSGLDLGAIEDPRLRNLCRGLLTRNPANRWGSEKVRSWLAGRDPEVIPDDDLPAESARSGRVLQFAGVAHQQRESLARAFVTSWDDATRRYLVGLHGMRNPSQAWLSLRSWLEQFDDQKAPETEGLVSLIDDRLLSDLPPDVKMLHLVRWLDPRLPPVYRGFSMDPESLAGIARRASSSEDPRHTDAARVVGDLWQHTLLPVLANMPGGEPLQGVHQRWITLWGEGNQRAAQLLGGVPVGRRPSIDQSWALAILLFAAADPHSRDVLATMRATAAGSVPGPVSWFDSLAAEATGGPLDDLVVAAAAPVAAEEAQAAIAEAERMEAVHHARRQTWSQMEADRNSGADPARTRALVYSGGISALMLVDLLAYGGFTAAPSTSLITFSVIVGIAVAGLIGWTELEHARDVAGQYANFAPFSRGASAIGRLGESIDSAGKGCGALIAGSILVSFAVSLPILFYTVIAVIHLVTWKGRRQAWRAAHDAERTRVLGGP